MTKNDIREIIYNGNLVKCKPEDYETIRRYLQEISGEFIDNGDGFRAVIALNEVKRLDKEFNFSL